MRWNRHRSLMVMAVSGMAIVGVTGLLLFSAFTSPVNLSSHDQTTSPESGSPSPNSSIGIGAGGRGNSAVSTRETRNDPGSAAVGSTRYAVPSSALFVDSVGARTGDGSTARPFSTIQSAVDSAPTGSTIVIRGGTYHESLSLPAGKKLTVQSYPNEAVWLDGSRVISGWSNTGSAWVFSGWKVKLDSSPTYTRGEGDGGGRGWNFLNPAYPMAAHPDQVWIDGMALTQVASRDQVKRGTFFVDPVASKLYVGSNPIGHEVRSSDLVNAAVVVGDGSVLRGFGVRRFAPSVPDVGALAVYGSGVTVENLVITDNATTGLSLNAAHIHVTNVTVARNGMLGAHANYADNLTVTKMLSADNNIEHFNRSPVAGGLKITRSRHIRVSHSAFLRNDGNAIWFDESVYDGQVISNDVVGNTGNAIVIEISAAFAVADNVVANNGIAGLLISDSNQVDIWNNTVTGNNRNVNIVQGDRRASNLSTPGHDSRQRLPDPTMTWITGQVTVSNNILANSTGNCILCVEDYSHQRSAGQMQIHSNGNVYQRKSSMSPAWSVVWSRGAGNPAVYSTVAEWAAATGEERKSLVLDGSRALTSQFAPLVTVTTAAPSIAQALPANIAGLVGQPVRTRVLGAWPAR